VVGGGFTGLAAALTLAEAGAEVVLLDAERPGWGASGRNGGLVSIGSAKLSDAAIRRRFGAEDASLFFDAERAAVDHVAALIARHGIEVDRHSDGYTFVAHSPAEIGTVRAYGESYRDRYGLEAQFLSRAEMAEHGLKSPAFHAATTVPVGFALNPMKFVLGLARAAAAAGVRIFAETPVLGHAEENGDHVLSTPGGHVRARHVLFATNGYGSETVPRALAARYLPVQSNILVTRPLSEAEIAAQGWWSGQMVVDSRQLLHYFRLMPDRRVLFGLRGSVRATEAGLAAARAQARRDFERIFPAWAEVETPHFWSGLICMTRRLVPFAGRVPGMERAFAAFGYHGSGVSMAPYAGTLIADMALGRSDRPHPLLMQAAPRRFELGRFRRSVLGPVFALYQLRDRASP
jgi:glycine/D-amino acid oxidase-like deaminating enzyme